MNTSIYKTRR